MQWNQFIIGYDIGCTNSSIESISKLLASNHKISLFEEIAESEVQKTQVRTPNSETPNY